MPHVNLAVPLLERQALHWTGLRPLLAPRPSCAHFVWPTPARAACTCFTATCQRREPLQRAHWHCSNRRLSLTFPKSPARHHRAAVQSNEVYPTPLTSALLACFGAASDKRFTLGVMRLDRATIADAPRISALIRELSKSFLVSPSGEGAEPFFAAIGEPAIHGYVSASNFVYLVAKAEGQLAGVVALRDNSHLFHLFVAEPFQGQGLGGKLWNTVKIKAIQSGNTGKFTVNSSLNALPFYERFGFMASGPVVRTHGVAFQPMQLSQAHNAA